MQLIHDISEPRQPLRAAVVTVGNFDGVHVGHQRLLRRVAERARETAMAAAVLTFDPHPTYVLAPDRAPKVLTPLPEKVTLIQATGVDVLWVRPFTLELSRMSPEEFLNDVLIQGLGARVVVVGPNFRFGHRQAGDVRFLMEFGRKHGVEVEVVDAMWVRGQMASSTRIRELAASGRVNLACRLLGRPFSVSGPIVSGSGIGRQHTVPTLNLAHVDRPINGQPPRQLPKTGVYVTRTRVAGSEHESVTNVGRKPTFGEHELTVEPYLLDYHGGRIEADTMEIQFLHRLRDERRFPDAASLKAQIMRDAERSLGYFRRLRLLRRARAATSQESH